MATETHSTVAVNKTPQATIHVDCLDILVIKIKLVNKIIYILKSYQRN